MPTIAFFLGISVAMYYRDHNPPHIHVIYGGFEGLFAIDDARLIRGKVPPAVAMIIREWIGLRRDLLLDNWNRARRHQPLERIVGLDDVD